MRILATSGGFLALGPRPLPWRRGPLIEHAIHLAGDPDAAPVLLRRHGAAATRSTASPASTARSPAPTSAPRTSSCSRCPTSRTSAAHLLAAGRDLGRWRLGRQPARRVAGARPRRGAARVLGERRRARRRLGRLDLLVRRRPDRQLRPRPSRSPRPGWACCPTATASTTTARTSAGRCCTRWSGTASLPTSHATDDGVGLVYEGTELVEAVADRPGVAAYVVERQADGSVIETADRAAGCWADATHSERDRLPA